MAQIKAHTPGPWTMIDRLDDGNNPCGINIASENGRIIARMPDGATVHGGKAWPETHSNARLIAEAPALLAAAKMALQFVEDVFEIAPPETDEDFEMHNNLRSSIARAERREIV